MVAFNSKLADKTLTRAKIKNIDLLSFKTCKLLFGLDGVQGSLQWPCPCERFMGLSYLQDIFQPLSTLTLNAGFCKAKLWLKPTTDGCELN
jgi:hypothetical protein